MAGRKQRGKQERRRNEQQAHAVRVPTHTDVAIVGGGAAGLAAAISAAEQSASVVVLEASLSIGRTILATGNGRCNFCAARLEAGAYNNPAFVEPLIGPQAVDRVLEFFLNSGLAWCREEDQLYPLSRQAASVRNVLIERALRAHVTLAPARRVVQLAPAQDGWTVYYEGEAQTGSLHASALILAGGGHQSDALVPSLPRTPRQALLCPLEARGLPFSELDGRRFRGSATLLRNGAPIAEEIGEFLFRSYGVSGIAAFNLSRFAQPQDTLVLHMTPAHSLTQLSRLIQNAGSMDGVCDPKIAAFLWEAAEHNPHTAAELLKNLSCTIVGIADESHSQVTRGGLSTLAFDKTTLEADESLSGGRSLFACGEALDIDGPCGGYNLSWAWLSGIRAGECASRAIQRRP